METQLVIFLALTSVTLTANTLVIWFAYKASANMLSRLTESVREISASTVAREFIGSLETAALQIAKVTTVTKQQVENFDPILARAQDVYGYGLAKIDRKLETVCNVIAEKTERAQDTILRPATRIGMMATGVQSVLGVVAPDRD